MNQELKTSSSPKLTELATLHRSLGAKMIPFGGFLMPLNYPPGILAEHKHCRSNSSLFDVSHMGQFFLSSELGVDHMARSLESLVPGSICDLADGQLCYTMLTNTNGGIIDDLIVARMADKFLIIGNANNRDIDMETLQSGLSDEIKITAGPRGLLALQGPKSAEILSKHSRELANLSFMEGKYAEIGSQRCWVSRTGYTGEDGFEISASNHTIEEIAKLIYASDDVEMAGLGARDTLRLEAGLSLHGQDIDLTTTPVEAGLAWTIKTKRREEANFPGAKIILDQIRGLPPRRRIAITMATKAIARPGSPIINRTGKRCGTVTSGGFSPTTETSIAMGYIETTHPKNPDTLMVEIRGNAINALEVPLPFVTHRYFRN